MLGATRVFEGVNSWEVVGIVELDTHRVDVSSKTSMRIVGRKLARLGAWRILQDVPESRSERRKEFDDLAYWNMICCFDSLTGGTFNIIQGITSHV